MQRLMRMNLINNLKRIRQAKKKGENKMKQLKSYKTTTFADGDFRIDIVEKRTEFEAWIYRKSSGIKTLMFGSGKKQTIYGEAVTITFDMFVDLVESNLPEYKDGYDMDINIYNNAMEDYIDSLPQPELDTRSRRSVIVRTEAGDIEYIIIEENLAYEWKVPYKLCDKAVEGHLNAHTNPRYHEFETRPEIWKQTTVENILEVCEWNEVLGEKVTA